MILKGKTKEQIDKENYEKEQAILLDNAHTEVEAELQSIIRSIAIDKYIEKQKGI